MKEYAIIRCSFGIGIRNIKIISNFTKRNTKKQQIGFNYLRLHGTYLKKNRKRINLCKLKS